LSQTFRVNFWDNEDLKARSSNVSSRRVNATNVQSAMLNWDIKPTGLDGVWGMDGAITLKQLKFNNSVVVSNLEAKKSGSVDVRHLISANGNNTVEILLNAGGVWWMFDTSAGRVTVFLDVVASSAGVVDAPKLPSLSSLPWWVWGVIVVVVLLVLAWFLMRTSAGGRVVSAAYGTVKDAERVLKGAVG